MAESGSLPQAKTKPKRGRGGIGKYLRARGRGRGGRPAQWGERLVLDGEETIELDAEQEEELEHKYSRRQLGTNEDRYIEKTEDPDEEPEPEIDLTAFLEQQRASTGAVPGYVTPSQSKGDDDIDYTISNHSSRSKKPSKGRVTVIEWDKELEAMSLDKAAAEAVSDLKARFRGQPTSKAKPRKTVQYTAPLESDQAAGKPEMEKFLDDLLS